MYFLLIYDLVDDYIEKRTPYRPQHFEHIKAAQARGEFMMGGAFDPADQAGLLFKVDDISIVENFAKIDPYVLGGLVPNWWIRKWSIAIGG